MVDEHLPDTITQNQNGTNTYLTLQNLWKWHHYEQVDGKIPSKVMESNPFGTINQLASTYYRRLTSYIGQSELQRNVKEKKKSKSNRFPYKRDIICRVNLKI